MTDKMKELELLMTAELQGMAQYVAEHTPDDWAFCVLICETGIEPATVLYVSNADRVQMVGIIEDWIVDMKAENYRIPDESEFELPRRKS